MTNITASGAIILAEKYQTNLNSLDLIFNSESIFSFEISQLTYIVIIIPPIGSKIFDVK